MLRRLGLQEGDTHLGRHVEPRVRVGMIAELERDEVGAVGVGAVFRIVGAHPRDPFAGRERAVAAQLEVDATEVHAEGCACSHQAVRQHCLRLDIQVEGGIVRFLCKVFSLAVLLLGMPLRFPGARTDNLVRALRQVDGKGVFRSGSQREASLGLRVAGSRGCPAIVADWNPELRSAVLPVVLERLGTAGTNGFEDDVGILRHDLEVDGLLEGSAGRPFEVEEGAIDLQGFDVDALSGEVNHTFAAQGMLHADFAGSFRHIDAVFVVAVERIDDARAFERGIGDTRYRHQDQGTRVVAFVVADVHTRLGGVPFFLDALYDERLGRSQEGEAEGRDGQETE